MFLNRDDQFIHLFSSTEIVQYLQSHKFIRLSAIAVLSSFWHVLQKKIEEKKRAASAVMI